MKHIKSKIISLFLAAAVLLPSFTPVQTTGEPMAEEIPTNVLVSGQELNDAMKTLAYGDITQVVFLSPDAVDEVPEDAIQVSQNGDISMWYREPAPVAEDEDQEIVADAEDDTAGTGDSYAVTDVIDEPAEADGVEENEEVPAPEVSGDSFIDALAAEQEIEADGSTSDAADPVDESDAEITDVPDVMDPIIFEQDVELPEKNTIFIYSADKIAMNEDSSHIFDGLDALISVYGWLNVDTTTIRNFSYAFAGTCIETPYIAHLDLTNADDVSYLFYDAQIEDIEHLETHEVRESMLKENGRKKVLYTAWDISEDANKENAFQGDAPAWYTGVAETAQPEDGAADKNEDNGVLEDGENIEATEPVESTSHDTEDASSAAGTVTEDTGEAEDVSKDAPESQEDQGVMADSEIRGDDEEAGVSETAQAVGAEDLTTSEEDAEEDPDTGVEHVELTDTLSTLDKDQTQQAVSRAVSTAEEKEKMNIDAELTAQNEKQDAVPYSLWVKYTLADITALDGVRTIDEMFEKCEDAVIAQYPMYVPLYPDDDNDDYYMAYVSVASLKENIIEISDHAFAKNNYNGEEITDGVYDRENQIVKIPKKYFEEAEEGDQVPVQAQFLCVYDASHPYSDIPVTIDNQRNDVKIVADEQLLNIYDLDVQASIPVIAKESAGLVSLDDMDISVNGENITGADLAKYNSETGELVLFISPMNIASVHITIRNDDVVVASMRKSLMTVKKTAMNAMAGAGGLQAFGTLPYATTDQFQVGQSWKMTLKANSASNASATYSYAYDYSGNTWKKLHAGNIENASGHGLELFSVLMPTKLGDIDFRIQRGGKIINGNQWFLMFCNHVTKAVTNQALGYHDAGMKAKVRSVNARVRVLAVHEGSEAADNYVVVGIYTTSWTKEFNSPKITQAGTGIYKFTMQPAEGSLQIKKSSKNTDITKGDSHYSLEGAVFGVYSDKACTKRVAKLTTAANGKTSTVKLKRGTYYVRELKAPPGYRIKDTTWTVSVNSGKTTTKEIGDTPYRKGKVSIVKKDAVTGAALKTAEFIIEKYDNGSWKKVQTMINKNNGTYTTSETLYADKNNPNGKFRIRETKNPDNHTGSVSKEFTLKDNPKEALKWEFDNEQGPVSVKVFKVDKDSKTPLEGAEFYIYPYNNGTKTYDTAGIKMTYNATEKRFDAQVKSNKTNLGRFRIVETKNPEGYRGQWRADMVLLGTEAERIYTANNDPIVERGKVVIHKKDATGQPISGAIFKVYAFNVAKNQYETQPTATLKENGTIYESPTLNRIDKAGHAKRNDGRYIVREIKAPAGHVNSGWSHEFVIQKNGDTETIQLFEHNVVNEKNSIKLIKVSEDGEFLPGAVFEFTDPSGAKTSRTTNANGEIIIEGAAEGRWSYIETQAPAGYKPNKQRRYFTVDASGKINGKAHEEIVIENERAYYLTVVKNDTTPAGGTPYTATTFPAGTEFTAYEWNGARYVAAMKIVWQTDKFVDEATGEAPILTRNSKNEGKWQIKETKSTPGYILESQVRDITLRVPESNGDDPYHLTENFSNQANRFKIFKKDAQGRMLPGVKYLVWKDGESDMKTFTTDANGIIELTHLAPGTWNYMESEPPATYELDTTIYQFKVDANGRIKGDDTKTLVNYRKGQLELRKKDSKTGKELHIEGFPLGTEFLVYEWNEETQSYNQEPYGKLIVNRELFNEMYEIEFGRPFTAQDDEAAVGTDDFIQSRMTDQTYPNAIAVIDTGASANANVVEHVSLLGENAADDNGHGDRVIDRILSVDPNAQIVSIKAMNADGEGNASAIAQAVEYAITKQVKAINLSIAAPATKNTEIVKTALEKAIKSGIKVIGAAGNEDKNAKYFVPGNVDGAMIVGAMDENGIKTELSNYGDAVSTYMVADTTSEASAIMAGYVSLGLENTIRKTQATISSGTDTANDKADTSESDFRISAVGTATTVSYNYKNSVQTFTAPYAGQYTFTLKGAGGGTTDFKTFKNNGGAGGKTVGTVTLTKGQKIYIVTGGAGGSLTAPTNYFNWVHASSINGAAGGYNGGGAGGKGMVDTTHNKRRLGGAGGGGATHIATESGLLKNVTKSKVLMVAGGGGGGAIAANGGAGGGTSGKNTSKGSVSAAGGTQSSGNAYGVGANGRNASSSAYEASAEGAGGGGGGYYGGKASTASGKYSAIGGAGGSGYIKSGVTGSSTSQGDGAAAKGNGSVSVTYDGYVIKYNANGGSGSMSNTSAKMATNVTLRSNSFTRTGYTFAGWATSAGGAKVHNNGATVKDIGGIGATVNLYAVWTPNNYTIAYSANGGSGTTASQTVAYDANVTLRANGFSRTGYTFQGWGNNTTTKAYNAGQTLTKPNFVTSGTKTLYAIWSANSYQIKFNANGGSGSMGNLAMTYGTAKNLTANAFTRNGYTFNSWNTNAAGTGTRYTNGQSVNNLSTSNGAVINLYAQWSRNNYTISYDLDGGTSPTTLVTSYNIESNNIVLPRPTKRGYDFVGWSGSNGSTPEFTVTIPKGSTGNRSYKANWKKIEASFFVDEETGMNMVLQESENNRGKFKIVETSPTPGYINDKTVIYIDFETDLDAEGKIKKSTENEPNEFKIKKIDADTGEGLAGAKFDVWYEGDEANKTEYVTDENGEITIERLKPGTWYYQETEAPEGYLIDSTEYSIAIDRDGVVGQKEVQFTNTPHPDLYEFFIKKTNVSGVGLKDVEFRIEGPNNFETTAITNQNGMIQLTELEPGKYTVTETKTVNGFVHKQDEWTFEILEDGSSNPEIGMITVMNEPNQYEIIKVDMDGTPIKNAEFEIQHEDDEPFVRNTGTDGKIVLTELEEGRWTYHEVSAPPGYVLDETEYSFTVAADGTITDVDEPDVSKATGMIQNKENEWTLKKVDENGEPMSGVTFRIYSFSGLDQQYTTGQDGTIHLEKLPQGVYHYIETDAPEGYIKDVRGSFTVDETGRPDIETVTAVNKPNELKIMKIDQDTGVAIPGVSFILDNNGEQQTFTTDENGVAVLTRLTPGEYRFWESAAPENYQIDQTQHIFNVTEDGDIEYPEAEDGTVTIENKQYDKHPLKIRKIDGNEGTDLTGAVFALYEYNAETGAFDGEPIAFSTESNKEYTFGELQGTQKNEGRFLVKEVTPPKGYFGNFAQEIELEADMDVLVADNYKNSITLRKVADREDGDPLEDVEFKFYREGDEDNAATYRTDAEGKIDIEELAPGTWHYIETETVYPYEVDGIDRTFVVGEDGLIDGETHKDLGPIVNREPVDTQATIRLFKHDEAGEALSDAEFTVYERSEEASGGYREVAFLHYDAETESYVCNDTLRYTQDNLGRFKIVETKAPDGHEGGWETTFELDPEGDVIQEFEFDVTNFRNTLEIAKVDQDGNPMANVQFTVYRDMDVPENEEDREGTNIASQQPFEIETEVPEEVSDPEEEDLPIYEYGLTTDEEGMMVLSELDPGSYILVESERPEGYSNEGPWHFTVDEDNKIHFENEPPSYHVTSTIVNTKNELRIVKKNENNEDIPGAEIIYWFGAADELDPEETATNIEQEFEDTTGDFDDDELNEDPPNPDDIPDDEGDDDTGGADDPAIQGPSEDTEVHTATAPLTLEGVEDGYLYVQEKTAPNGYMLNPTIYQIEIKDGKIRTQSEFKAKDTLSVIDYTIGKNGYVSIDKFDADTGETITPDATGPIFGVYAWNESQQEYGTDPVTELVYRNGKYENLDNTILMTELNKGKFLVREIRAKTGYSNDGWQSEINISEKDRWEFYGEEGVANSKTGFWIFKTDGTKALDQEPLKGVKFAVWSESNTDPEVYETDDEGYVKLLGLLPNTTYFYQEVQELDGYDRDGEVHEFTVDSDGNINDQSQADGYVVDYPLDQAVNLELDKEDGLFEGRNLPGAEFTVYEWDNLLNQYDMENPVGKLTFNTETGTYTNQGNAFYKTDENEGKFFVAETKAPVGYNGVWDRYVETDQMNHDDDGFHENIGLTNSKNWLFTGGAGRRTIYLVGAAAAAALILIWAIRRRRNK